MSKNDLVFLQAYKHIVIYAIKLNTENKIHTYIYVSWDTNLITNRFNVTTVLTKKQIDIGNCTLHYVVLHNYLLDEKAECNRI